MLKTRVIPVLLYRNRSLVKGKQFKSWRNVGLAIQSAKVHESRQVDELIALDIGATPDGRGPDYDMVRDLTSNCFMPMTIGGGITTLDQVTNLMRAGADKVCINTAATMDFNFIDQIAKRYGSQAVVVSIDYNAEGKIVSNCAAKAHNLSAVDWARIVEDKGAGEILLNSIEHDGMMEGYDLPAIRSVSSVVKVPVIACGGAGCYEHMLQALQAGAHAVAAGALFAFTDATPKGAAQFLRSQGFSTRVAA